MSTDENILLLGIDVGTTGTKCALYDLKGNLVAHAYQEYPMIHPQECWTEQDPHRWWNAVQANLQDCFGRQGIDSARVASIGLSLSLIHIFAGDQIIKLMTLGLSEKEAEGQIVNGFLK